MREDFRGDTNLLNEVWQFEFLPIIKVIMKVLKESRK